MSHVCILNTGPGLAASLFVITCHTCRPRLLKGEMYMFIVCMKTAVHLNKKKTFLELSICNDISSPSVSESVSGCSLRSCVTLLIRVYSHKPLCVCAHRA